MIVHSKFMSATLLPCRSMPIEAKARPTAENCGWRQQGHAAVKSLLQKSRYDCK